MEEQQFCMHPWTSMIMLVACETHAELLTNEHQHVRGCAATLDDMVTTPVEVFRLHCGTSRLADHPPFQVCCILAQ